MCHQSVFILLLLFFDIQRSFGYNTSITHVPIAIRKASFNICLCLSIYVNLNTAQYLVSYARSHSLTFSDACIVIQKKTITERKNNKTANIRAHVGA